MTGGRDLLRPTPAELRWAAAAVSPGGNVVRCRRLHGGIVSAVHLLTVAHAGRRTDVVLKRWVDGEVEEHPAWVRREAAVLEALAGADIAAPLLLGSDDGSATGGPPALLLSRVPGRVWLAPRDARAWLRQLAATLAQIHALPPGGLPPVAVEHDPVRPPRDSRDPGLWKAAAALVASGPPPGAAAIHGDYQHFNVLWQRDRLSGVIDWTWGGVGHPDRDVGHCRLNLAVLFDCDRAQEFGRLYAAAAGRRIDPWWDVYEITRYDDEWRQFIPVQVAGRAAVDAAGMTGRVEDLLRRALAG